MIGPTALMKKLLGHQLQTIEVIEAGEIESLKGEVYILDLARVFSQSINR